MKRLLSRVVKLGKVPRSARRVCPPVNPQAMRSIVGTIRGIVLLLLLFQSSVDGQSSADASQNEAQTNNVPANRSSSPSLTQSSDAAAEQRMGSARSLTPQRLSTGSYSERQRATLEMWRQRTLSRQMVQDAARDEDPEIAERAQWILRQWRSGNLPGPQGEKTRPTGGSRPTALATVLEQGAFEAVLIAVEESAGTIEFEQIKRRVAKSLTERFPIYIDSAIADGTLPDFVALIDAVADNQEMATSSWDLKRHLGHALDLSNCLPKGAETWVESERLIAKSLFASINGDAMNAIELAGQAGDLDTGRMTKMINDRWDLILESERQRIDQSTDVQDSVEAYAWMCAAAYRLGDAESLEQAKAFLVKASAKEAKAISELRWRILAMHDAVDEAIRVAAQDDQASAAKIAVASSRHEAAIKHTGFDLSLLTSDLESWVDEALAEQSELSREGVGQLAPTVERLYALARLLVRLHDTENAKEIYRRLDSREFIVTPWGHSLLDLTLTELSWAKQYDLVGEIAVKRRDNNTVERTRLIIAKAAGTDKETFDIVVAQMQQLFPRTSYYDRFRMAFELFRGRVPDGFDSERDFERLFVTLPSQAAQREALSWKTSERTEAFGEGLLDLFALHGKLDLVQRGDRLLAEKGDLDAKIRLAEASYLEGDFRTALERWEEVAIESSRFDASTALITLDHGVNYAKSLVGRWLVARRSGFTELAEDYELRLRLMAMSPSLKLRHELAEYISDQGQSQLAVETLGQLVIQNSYGGPEAPDQFNVAVAYVTAISRLKEEHPKAVTDLDRMNAEIMKWSDLAVLGILNEPYLERTFVGLPLSVRTTKLQYAIDTKQGSLAEQAIKQIEHYDPLNIDFGERLIPKLREAGFEEIANHSIDQLMDRGLVYASQYPFDATSLNNFAWTAAVNEQRLDDALLLSRRAVMLEPDSVVFRDTLAEVLHCRGDDQQALAIESACLLDQPDEWHLHQQIEKYRQATVQQE
ncbi:tetratricopeptide repeat protein [Roseiconus lacunae]|uniref:hypothetical protein n=1 Tax=Roseiconus lacunae TaxID=2605694 RepID=UPI001E5853C1|nr:hypothetical protein [Roseiconus lacunae]MCD0460714.1 hypothetical protein [Roseiconus lacunae]